LENSISNLYICLYVAAWIITIVVYQKKKQRFDSGSIILFSFLLYAIISLILYNITDSSFGSFETIQLFPFIYLFLMLLIAVWPILKYDETKIAKIQKPNVILFNSISSVFIYFSIIQLPTVITNFLQGLIKLSLNSEGGQELYDDGMVNSDKIGNGSIENLAAIISNAMSVVGVLFLFYYLTIKKRNKLFTIGLFLSVTINILASISRGQRGGIVEPLLVMIITYFTLREFIPVTTKKYIRIIGISLMALGAIPLLVLTNSRFGERSGGSEESFYFYVGQANLFFNNYGLDDGGFRYGDRTFNLFKSILGFENVPNNFMERRQKYPNLKINDEVFYTFVGDFTIDYGPFVSVLLFIIFTLIVLNQTKIRQGRILMHQLVLLHFVLSVCILGGMKLYPFSDVGGNLQLIVYVIVFILFKIDHMISLK
jgi:oligosaccharide repeat unit polymerase